MYARPRPFGLASLAQLVTLSPIQGAPFLTAVGWPAPWPHPAARMHDRLQPLEDLTESGPLTKLHRMHVGSAMFLKLKLKAGPAASA